MATSYIEGDVFVRGTFGAKTFRAPSASVGNAAIESNAGVEASKLQHQYERVFSQERATDAAVEGKVVHVVAGATGTVLSVSVGSVVAAGASSSATVDVLKNGTTILTGTVVVDNGNTAYVGEAGTVSVSALVAGDVIEARVTAVSGANKPKGVFVSVVIREDAQ